MTTKISRNLLLEEDSDRDQKQSSNSKVSESLKLAIKETKKDIHRAFGKEKKVAASVR